MTRWHGGSRFVRLSLALVAITTASAAAIVASSASASTTTKQIAIATLGHDFRTVLTATRGSAGGGAPTATVKIAAYERSAGQWKSLGHQTVGDPDAWFWNVVTEPGAICLLSTSDRDPYPIEVRLLLSESLGCSPVTYNFHVDKYGRLAPG